jgi:hypothetical protein
VLNGMAEQDHQLRRNSAFCAGVLCLAAGPSAAAYLSFALSLSVFVNV